MSKKTIRDITVEQKRVLVRVDLNLPIDEATGQIIDDSRIKAVLPTIKYLTEHQARVILISHLGRPKGKVVEKLRMGSIAARLSEILGQPVEITRDCVGPEAASAVNKMQDGDVILLENLRFHPEEEANNADFARSLASLADIYVNDAFGTAHRAHASVVGVTEYLPSVAGLLLEKEIKNLSGILKNPTHPFAALLGGAKVSDKVAMIDNIMAKVNFILIGGGMAASFLKAQGYDVGSSSVESDIVAVADRLLKHAQDSGVQLLLPNDVVVTDDITLRGSAETVPIGDIPANRYIVDIGPKTIERFRDTLRGCRTVFWNGPMGIYEIKQFATGTLTLARVIASLEATTVIGGGSTADAITDLGLADKFSFVSTGGGASLDFLSGKTLPGIAALPDKEP